MTELQANFAPSEDGHVVADDGPLLDQEFGGRNPIAAEMLQPLPRQCLRCIRGAFNKRFQWHSTEAVETWLGTWSSLFPTGGHTLNSMAVQSRVLCIQRSMTRWFNNSFAEMLQRSLEVRSIRNMCGESVCTLAYEEGRSAAEIAGILRLIAGAEDW